MREIDSVLGVIEIQDTTLSSDVEHLIEERNSARAKKDFKRSDEIRAQLEKKGIILEDTPTGTLWKRSL